MISCVLDFYLWEPLEMGLRLGPPTVTDYLEQLELKCWALDPQVPLFEMPTSQGPAGGHRFSPPLNAKTRDWHSSGWRGQDAVLVHPYVEDMVP